MFDFDGAGGLVKMMVEMGRGSDSGGAGDGGGSGCDGCGGSSDGGDGEMPQVIGQRSDHDLGRLRKCRALTGGTSDKRPK